MSEAATASTKRKRNSIPKRMEAGRLRESLKLSDGDLSGFPDPSIAGSEVASVVDALDVMDCRNFHLRLKRIRGGFRRPEMMKLTDASADEPDGAFCTLLHLDDAAASDTETSLVTAYLSDDLLPSAEPRPVRPPQQASLVRRLRFAISPLWQLDHEWRRTRQKIAARDRRGDPAPLRPPAKVEPTPVQRDTTKPPTLLIGMHFLEVGGAESFAIDTALAAAEKYRVIVVTDTPARHDQRRRLETKGNIRVFHMDRHVPAGLDLEFLAALVAKENVFAIHINHCTSLYAALPRLKSTFPEIAVIDTTHILENADGGYCTVSGLYTHHIDRHHAVGQQVRDYLAAGFGAGDRIRGGYVTHRSVPAPAVSNLDARQTASPVRIAFVGRMTQQKRPMLFVAAAAGIRRSLEEGGFDSQYLMMGDESLRPALTELARRQGVADALDFRPPDYGADRLLADCHVLLMTSDVEGIAFVALEAVSAGAMVISTDVGGQREIVPRSLLLSAKPSDFVREASDIVLRLVADETFRGGVWAETLRLHRALRSARSGLDEVLDFFEEAGAGR